jgi:hypothetical protein
MAERMFLNTCAGIGEDWDSVDDGVDDARI